MTYDDDGVWGPVGERLAGALAEAGARLGVPVQGLDRITSPAGSTEWVDATWEGRRLNIGASTYGPRGATTGYRWIIIRLETRTPRGSWADAVRGSNDPRDGIQVPITSELAASLGTWAERPALGEDLAAFAAGLPERAAALQAQDRQVMWGLLASALDAEQLVRAVQLLGQVADHAEAHDAATSARLGKPPGASRVRLLEAAVAILVLGIVVAGVVLLFAIL